MVLVSVVMLSYNHEKYISEAIDSVLNQTLKDFELIIVDDCSKDSSKEIVNNYQRKDERIRAFLHKTNMGIARTANQGFAEAKGRFIAIIASDDAWKETKLEKQLAILENDESLIVWSEGEIIDKNSVPTGKTFTQMYSAPHEKRSGNLFEELIYRNFIFGSSVILKSDLVKETQFCEKLKYYSDYKFMVDLSKDRSFFFIPEPLARYRIHGKNTILSDEEGWMQDEITLDNYFLQRYNSTIPNRIKADLLFRAGSAYSYFGNKAVARKTFFKAISLDLLRKDDLYFLIYALTSGEDNIAKFFTRLRSCYKLITRTLKYHSRALAANGR